MRGCWLEADQDAGRADLGILRGRRWRQPLVLGSGGQGSATGGVETGEWVSALGRYAERLHARAGQGHHVVSPLGAWMVVALCAAVSGDEQARGELAGVLGA